MPSNVKHWEWRTDEYGKRVRDPIPFDCHGCGRPSHYGKAGAWWCTFCWQERARRASLVEAEVIT